MPTNPKASIIIATLDNSDLTLDCVESVVDNTTNLLYEIIIVDNGSTATEVEKLVRASNPGFNLVSLNRNLFFGEANNIGAEHANADYLVFLNNDVRVTPGWLDQLMMTLNNEVCAGAVGPKFLYPNGTLQEAGAYIRPDGWTVQMGKCDMPLPPSYADTTKVVDYCSAACLLMKRKDFLDLGGFDPIFDPAYFEDVDLALRLRSIGLFTYFCGEAVVYHELNATSSRLWSDEQIRRYCDVNRDRFLRRWGGYLQRRLNQNCEPEKLPSLVWEPESVPNEKETAVLFSSNSLTVAENSRRLLLVASAFQETHDVVIAADEFFSRCRVYSLCRQFGIELSSFRVRNISRIDQSKCDVIISFDGYPSTGRILGPHLVFECDGRKLLELIEDLE